MSGGPRVIILAVAGLLFGIVPVPAAFGDYQAELQALQKEARPASERFKKLLDLTWAHTLEEFPEFATQVGIPDHNDRWSDLSAEAIERRKAEARTILEVVHRIDRAQLAPAEQVSYDLFRREAELDVESQKFPAELMVLNQLQGVHQNAPRVIAQMPFKDVRDYENLISRLKKLPTLIDQHMALLERGLAEGVTPPQITLRDVPQQIENVQAKDPQESPLLQPFKELPEGVSETERKRLREAASEAVRSNVAPALDRFRRFVVEKYVPGARATIGIDKVPNGTAWYGLTTRQQTTTDLSPEKIHEIGLSEVKRIRSEMAKIIERVGFQGTFAEFAEYLRTDPKFYYKEAQELLRDYRDIAKRTDPELVKLFGILPRLPYAIEPVPSYAEKSQTAAYYEQGSLAAGRPGTFFVNTYDLPSRPKWGMETLTLHEAVPGHHFQIAIAQEMEDLPEFRKHGWYTAFGEGWALYAESLGFQMGFFKDPYQHFGHLSDEMWRAVRLVVDTGLHSKNWTRDQAIAYFKENTPTPEHDIIVEIDRYIVWPSQALGYKIGQLKIQELRATAQRELGAKFDLRSFHDEVLRHGVLPLQVLETQIKEWITKTKKA